jgi:hypothetical protein
MKLLFVNKMLILALIVVILGFSSCSFTQTGTVTITVEEYFGSILSKVEPGEKHYYIYMDDVYQGMSINLVPLTLENIPVGIHTFKAYNYLLAADSITLKENEGLTKDSKITVIPYNCVGSIISEITVGVNYVDIPVFCTSIIM